MLQGTEDLELRRFLSKRKPKTAAIILPYCVGGLTYFVSPISNAHGEGQDSAFGGSMG